MIQEFSGFKEIWFVDFEYQQNGSNLPVPICLVAHELRTNKTFRLWKEELKSLTRCPFNIGEGALFVTYFASAELWCFHELQWDLPKQVLDLHVEFFHLTNGLRPKGIKASLLGAAEYFGIPSESSAHKDAMRDLILNNQNWTPKEREDILQYCESDVIALKKLFLKMSGKIDVPHALFRGKYLLANSKMEVSGIPLDVATLRAIHLQKESILRKIVTAFDPNGEIFDELTFKEKNFESWLKQRNIPWPRTDTGKLKLDKETFKTQALKYPEIEALKEIRKTLTQLRETSLTCDELGRSRSFYAPFSSLTSRNQPSNSKFIFGFAKWFRFLIKPAEGRAIAYIDWSQQEFGIAAALSGDQAMMAAYLSGDPYMAFAIQAKAAPEGATKGTHGEIRARFKQCILAVQYGMGAQALAQKLNIKFVEAQELLRLHKKVYSTFWRWLDSAVNHAMLTNKLESVFKWTWNITKDSKITTIRNFHMQANGAEMIRLACILALEDGVKVCAPVHDAILIEAPFDEIEIAVQKTQAAMARASRTILNGFELNSEARIVKHPDRYSEEESRELWVQVCSYLTENDAGTCQESSHVMPQNETPALSHLISDWGNL